MIKRRVVPLAQRSDHIIGFPDESAVPAAPASWFGLSKRIEPLKERTQRGALYPDDGHPKPERKGNAGIPEGLEGI
jgi:hypothetical protein